MKGEMQMDFDATENDTLALAKGVAIWFLRVRGYSRVSSVVSFVQKILPYAEGMDDIVEKLDRERIVDIEFEPPVDECSGFYLELWCELSDKVQDSSVNLPSEVRARVIRELAVLDGVWDEESDVETPDTTTTPASPPRPVTEESSCAALRRRCRGAKDEHRQD
jgi:hypothetical protein